MLVAVVSDTHSNMTTIRAACAILQELAPAAVIHCGDIDSPLAVLPFGGIGVPVHFTLGNCDWDRSGTQDAIDEAGMTLHPDEGQLEIDGVRLYFTHGHHSRLLQQALACGEHDFVFSGHTHVKGEWVYEPTTHINPGALQRARVMTFGLLDTATRKFDWVVV